jgi:L-ascorbate metabolism protein UlaG (beta-lactamase superfamily)
MLFDGMVEWLKPHAIDVALLPINGRASERRVAGNLWGREAAQLAKDIGAKLVVPCHYDMFGFNTATPEEFTTTCEQIGQPYRVLQLGERCRLTK